MPTHYELLGGKNPQTSKEDYVNDMIVRFNKVIDSKTGKLKKTKARMDDGSSIYSLSTDEIKLTWTFYIRLSESPNFVVISFCDLANENRWYELKWDQHKADEVFILRRKSTSESEMIFENHTQKSCDIRNFFKAIWEDLQT